ncbi:hypothetical protein B0H13DRAFT_1909851 [Mycena leptocephala]|nr:hypothetical protein B0H13DRAFT_1909851 [Mycena leptocephala]
MRMVNSRLIPAFGHADDAQLRVLEAVFFCAVVCTPRSLPSLFAFAGRWGQDDNADADWMKTEKRAHGDGNADADGVAHADGDGVQVHARKGGRGSMTLLRYMNLSEHLVSTFNFAILHSLDTHFVYLLAIKSMPIMINPNPAQPNPTQPNPSPNPNPKPTAVSHSLLIFFKTTVLHTPASNPNSPCPFFLSI